ncbi:peptidoglycan DD-metalloendopeptidase family protein [Melghirimyces algeriensis]|uniref:Murein DD-endopeptidase MepM and murein hydrolase activator NlpD, contain LysM domain n=1 Tax=Melghirimyces algeriensis TaxID=910412 RepID=A0A521E939_9BACL|nr:peptidoglycan DD-metalloendopeptidase family protein [Melghirimyces algeriensis]SMO80423.1 Murein DD-endopeptidase MepM and murein hydrolase activator NlpD, contain LysM domain [Melghirimyces algeriensis]
MAVIDRVKRLISKGRKGAATLEFVMILPLVILMCVVVWQLIVAGMALWEAQSALKNGVRLAASSGSAKEAEREGRSSFQGSDYYSLDSYKVEIKDKQAIAKAKVKIKVLFMSSSPITYTSSAKTPLYDDARSQLAGSMTLAGPLVTSGGRFGPPVKNMNVTSSFGMRFHPVKKVYKLHTGTDFAGGVGTPIYAAGDGVVTRAGPSRGYGNLIIINHGNGLETWYAHMFSHQIGVRVGDRVKRGDHIAGIGNAGYSTGAHLHFEVRYNGKPVNPMPYLNGG